MGEFDFTYSVPANFNKRVVQFLQQFGKAHVAQAFQRCEYEYVNSADFESFWKRYSDHVRQYDFPLQIKRPFNVLPYPNAAARVATLILTRDGFDFPVYFIAFKIS